MNRKPFEEFMRKPLPFPRRWIAGGALGAALFGTGRLLATEEVAAGKRGKKGKKKCRGKARKLAECLPGEDTQWCTPAPGNPRTCCPEKQIYAVCDLDAKTASGECGAPEAQAPSVCCPKSRLCGNRCCEGPFTCVNASTSTCTGEPPIYARLRRPR